MKAIIENVRDFNIDQVFDCGQCFRWTKQDNGSYTGIAMERIVNVQFEPSTESTYNGRIIIDNASDEDVLNIWHKYMDFDRDYGLIKSELASKEPVISKAIEHGRGIRILRQDIWETLLSFIISQNNNIPRIRGCIETLAEQFGTTAGEYDGKVFYSMPSPQRLAELTEDDLKICKLGYRASYLIEAGRKVASEGMETLRGMSDPSISDNEAREYLLSFKGVGPKVASCIMLFGMGRMASFPIDVWVKRVMNKLYGIDEKDTKTMTSFACEHFGDLGGIAQQYLFYYIRYMETGI